MFVSVNDIDLLKEMVWEAKRAIAAKGSSEVMSADGLYEERENVMQRA